MLRYYCYLLLLLVLVNKYIVVRPHNRTHVLGSPCCAHSKVLQVVLVLFWCGSLSGDELGSTTFWVLFWPGKWWPGTGQFEWSHMKIDGEINDILYYSSSHNHGSVEHECISNIIVSFHLVGNFLLYHDYGRKGIPRYTYIWLDIHFRTINRTAIRKITVRTWK